MFRLVRLCAECALALWKALRNMIELAQDVDGLATTGKPTDLHR